MSFDANKLNVSRDAALRLLSEVAGFDNDPLVQRLKFISENTGNVCKEPSLKDKNFDINQLEVGEKLAVQLLKGYQKAMRYSDVGVSFFVYGLDHNLRSHESSLISRLLEISSGKEDIYTEFRLPDCQLVAEKAEDLAIALASKGLEFAGCRNLPQSGRVA